MTDAINAKSDVLGERELDRVSGGFIVKGDLRECAAKTKVVKKTRRPKCFNRFFSN
jgi:hypothetical protein